MPVQVKSSRSRWATLFLSTLIDEISSSKTTLKNLTLQNLNIKGSQITAANTDSGSEIDEGNLER